MPFPMHKFLVQSLGAVAIGAFASSASADTVFDFDDTPPTVVYSGEPFAQQAGFQLSVGDFTYGLSPGDDYAIIDTAAAFNPVEAPLGNSTQFYSALTSWITIDRPDGALFSINSVDVAIIGAPTGTVVSGLSYIVFAGEAGDYSYYDAAILPRSPTAVPRSTTSISFICTMGVRKSPASFRTGRT